MAGSKKIRSKLHEKKTSNKKMEEIEEEKIPQGETYDPEKVDILIVDDNVFNL